MKMAAVRMGVVNIEIGLTLCFAKCSLSCPVSRCMRCESPAARAFFMALVRASVWGAMRAMMPIFLKPPSIKGATASRTRMVATTMVAHLERRRDGKESDATSRPRQEEKSVVVRR